MDTFKSLATRLRLYWRNHTTRRQLARRLHEMDARELGVLMRDVGLSRSDLIEEASRPIWAASASSNDAASAKPGTRSKSPMPVVRDLRAWQ